MKHGGNTPQVQKAAKLRLAALVDPSITFYATLLKKANYALGRGRTNSIFLKEARSVAKEILDRNGFKPVDEIQLSGPGGGPVIDMSQIEGADNDALEKLGRIVGAALARLDKNESDEGPASGDNDGDTGGASS